MRFETRPLPAVWPTGRRTPIDERRRSPFRATLARTLDHLEWELRQLEAVFPVVLEAGYQSHEIRLDGRPRAGASPRDPAVVISFESQLGPLRYACDAFDEHAANLRAIGLTLEHLRAVDRYGVTKRGEQYSGWLQLTESAESREEAEAFIREQADGTGPDLLAAYRAAARRLHPDTAAPGIDPALWGQLQRAKVAVGL